MNRVHKLIHEKQQPQIQIGVRRDDISNEHHVYNKDGSLKGVYVVTDGVTHKFSVWDRIEEAIQDYTKIHPMEMEAVVRQNKLTRDSRANQFGATKGKSIRYGASMPVALLFRLQQIEPALFEDPALFTKFLKKYKGLRTCKTV